MHHLVLAAASAAPLLPAGGSAREQAERLLLAAAAATLLVWGAVLLLAVVATRSREVDPGPATMELGDEPPAVVNLLANDWRVTADAVPATLLDLAGRDLVDIDQLGPEDTIVRVRRAGDASLAPYERLVLDHVAGLAVDGVVPAQALTTGPQDQSKRWWKAFTGAVVADARQRGLARDRWSQGAKAAVRGAALPPAVLGAVWLLVATDIGFGAAVVGFIAFTALAGAPAKFAAERDTPAGREAAARWLGVRTYLANNELFRTLPPAAVAIWDRYLGYGAAMGVATAAVRALPMGAEDENRAWSAYGGTWRVVEVNYPRARILWGRHPVVGFLIAVVIAAVGYGATRLMLGLRGATDGYTGSVASWVRLIATLLLVTAVALLVWAISAAVRALLDAASHRRFKGQVLRLRSWSDEDNKVRYLAAVDDGKATKVKAWFVPQAVYSQLRTGSLVDMDVGPRLGHVFRIERVHAATPDTAGSPAPSTVPAAPTPSGPAPSAPTPSGPAPSAATAAGAVPVEATAAGAVPVEAMAAGAVPVEAMAAGQLAASFPALLGGLLAAGPNVDPSTLVTADEASRVLGEPVGPATTVLGGRSDAVMGMRGCQYVAASGSGSSVAVFTASGGVVRVVMQAARRLGDPQPGIGDGAYLRQDSIVASRGEVAVTIRLQGRAAGSGKPDALRQLAAAAVRRL